MALFNLTDIIDKGILDYMVIGNTIKDYLVSIIVFSIVLIIFRIFKHYVISRLKKIAAKTKTKYDDLVIDYIDHIGWPIYILLSILIAMYTITIPDLLRKITYYIILIIVTYYAVRTIQALVDYGTHQIILKRRIGLNDHDTSMVDLINRLLKAILWLIAILLIISNLGYDVTALVAGLGIGGVAIAFALQSILGDIFASFSIYFDKPFQVGDYIVFGDNEGTVKKVGIKSTRILALAGQEIVISNKNLTDMTVHNLKKMEQRRVLFNFSVVYDTSTKHLKEIPNIIKEIIEKMEFTKFDRAHFSKFGDSSIIFEVVYYVKSGEYNKYMDIQQAINLAIKEKLEERKIEIAYPTQTINIQRDFKKIREKRPPRFIK